MPKCPLCGKELKHKGALNGHLAFAHGVVTEKGKTLNELREEVATLREEMDLLRSYFKPYKDKIAGNEIDSLITYERLSGKALILREFNTENWKFDEDGNIIVKARLVEEKRTIVKGRLAEVKPTIEKGKLVQLD